jgi:hypothetical protein
MNLFKKFSSRYFKNKNTLMKDICNSFVDNIINILDQNGDLKNKEFKLIEVYFFALSFISHIFFLKNANTSNSNRIFDLFLSDIFIKMCGIYRIDSANLEKGTNEFILHFDDRKDRYIASFLSDLSKHQNIFSDTICDFILHLYEEIDSNALDKLKIPFSLQLSQLITTCSDQL